MVKAKGAQPKTGITYLLTGEDEFKKLSYLNKLKADIADKEPDAFNYNLYYAKEATAEDVIRSIETFPLTGGKKLVVLRDLEDFPQQEKTILLDYVKKGFSDNAVLVLVSSKSPAVQRKSAGSLQGKVEVLSFSKSGTSDLLSWIRAEFKKRGKTIERNLAEYMLRAENGDFGRLSSVIEQISLFKADKPDITLSDVSYFTDITHESSTFKLLDFINDKDAGNALLVLKNLLKSGTNPVQVVGLISWHVTRLMKVKRLLLRNMPRRDISSYVKASGYVLNKLIAQAGGFSIDKLKGNLEELLDADLKIKRSNISGEIILEALVVRLAS